VKSLKGESAQPPGAQESQAGRCRPEGEKAADAAAVQIQARLAQGDRSVLGEQKGVTTGEIRNLPRLRDALPEWINLQERSGEIRPRIATSQWRRVWIVREVKWWRVRDS
jgi:hypothetical protein